MVSGKFALAEGSSLNSARTMLRRSNSRMIALVTALLLLLCQAAFAAQICAQQVAAKAERPLSSCHHAAESDDGSVPPADQSGGGCEAPALTGQHAVDLPILAVTALPALPIDAQSPAPSFAGAPAALAFEPHCRPPPLSILHCRFQI
jgi:hypothetical protein